jgi:hypothetical protein
VGRCSAYGSFFDMTNRRISAPDPAYRMAAVIELIGESTNATTSKRRFERQSGKSDPKEMTSTVACGHWTFDVWPGPTQVPT